MMMASASRCKYHRLSQYPVLPQHWKLEMKPPNTTYQGTGPPGRVLQRGLPLTNPFSHWGEEMAQFGETTECAIITLSSYVGKSFPWWILLCSPHLKSRDQFTIFTRWTVEAELPNSPWTRIQTISKEWKLRRTNQWRITQTV